MSQRADFYTSFLDAMKAMIGLEVEVGKLGLEPAGCRLPQDAPA
ncbi:MAG TPA: hypothetical protein VFG03_20045 [Telluria sp.]|nr:hypothetical protein [Telluria sp.]